VLRIKGAGDIRQTVKEKIAETTGCYKKREQERKCMEKKANEARKAERFICDYLEREP